MMTSELLIGECWYPAVGKFTLTSWRGLPLTVLNAEVSLGPSEEGEDVSFRYGYAEPSEWTGTVTRTVKGGDLMTVRAVGRDEIKLTGTRFKESFIEETAGSIVKAALAATGLTTAVIDAPGVQIARYTADDIPVWQAVEQVEESLRKGHGLTGYALWLGSGGLRWTTGDEPGAVPEIVTGVNLIDHAPCNNGLSKVTAFMIPGFSHSRRFRIVDTRRGIEETYRAESVMHELDKLHARTHICYRRGV